MVLGLLMLGVLLIIISIILIIKYKNDENIKMMKINEIYSEIDEYSNTLNDIIINLEDLVGNDNKNYQNNNSQKKELDNIIINKNKNSKQKNIKEEMLSLYKNGKTSDEIAKMLNKGKREVEIILKLNDFNKI